VRSREAALRRAADVPRVAANGLATAGATLQLTRLISQLAAEDDLLVAWHEIARRRRHVSTPDTVPPRGCQLVTG
jgi:transposase